MTLSDDLFHFDNTYARLPERFYQRVHPTPVKSPELVLFNSELALELGLSHLAANRGAKIFSGNEIPPGAEPIALAYAGHQFGNFVPQLGDGRAVLLGEVKSRNQVRLDIQLKGSGPTKFSRRGDGRAALGPAIREFILSEAMAALGVPTTRSLAVVTTGEVVYREQALPGAVVTRVSRSHVRVGTFEYFAALQDREGLRILADYVIDRHFPELSETDGRYLALYQRVVSAQAKLIAQWAQVGFIHGVMNTDNMAVSGETIDYGPCAFLDEYAADTVFSSIDQYGRYAFGNQSKIAQWNLQSLGACLSPLYSSSAQEAGDIINREIESFHEQFERHWSEGIAQKLGISKYVLDDRRLIDDLLELMQRGRADYTLSFRYLSGCDQQSRAAFVELFSEREGLEPWLAAWRKRLEEDERPLQEVARSMRAVNPLFIPRNHRVEQAINAAVVDGDFSQARRLNEVLKKPFVDQPENHELAIPPKPEERVTQTFCGT